MEEDIYYWITALLAEKKITIGPKSDDALGDFCAAVAEENGRGVM